MLRDLAAPRVRVFALLVSILWAWTVVAGQVHDLWVQHVVCAEHHEVLEVHRTQASGSHDKHPDAFAGARPTAHDHGCSVELLPSLTAPPAPGIFRIPLRVGSVAEQAPPLDPVRPPPLDYAPKTSPPVVAWEIPT